MRTELVALALAALLLAGCVRGPAGEPLDRGDAPDAPPAAVPPWAAADGAAVKPGVPIRTAKGDCPSNFVFARADNGSVFLGTTAYCVRELPIGALATVGGAQNIAVLVYSSWITMEEIGETDPDAREYNDFAVFYVDSGARAAVSPQLPDVGGPRGEAAGDGIAVGSLVRAHAGSPVTVLGQQPPAWRDAVVTGRAGDWALLVHAAMPAMPGYTGGAVVTPDGKALGIVVNVGVLPDPGSNGVARLDAVLAYARDHAKLDMVVATP